MQRRSDTHQIPRQRALHRHHGQGEARPTQEKTEEAMKEKPIKPPLTEDQQFCKKMLIEWACGEHHLPEVRVFGSGIHINHYGDLSTFDFDRLTRLVLLAHRDAVRIEIKNSGPRMVRIIAHRRKHDDAACMSQRHPSLDDLIQQAEKLKQP